MARDVMELANELKARGEPFAMATVVRTVAATAAKAGAKALIAPGGAISGGWIGGGCARAAVLKAAAAALADGQPRLLSVQPADVLAAQGISPSPAQDGIQFATNSCPSQGTMDIFVEPFLPRPHLLILGASPVAAALAELAARMGLFVTAAAPRAEHGTLAAAARLIDGFAIPEDAPPRFIVVATQGSGDLAALTVALRSGATSIAFVGSSKKAAALKSKLAAEGHAAARLAAIQAPAGLDLGAITPDEIALSIVAALIAEHRRGQRTMKESSHFFEKK